MHLLVFPSTPSALIPDLKPPSSACSQPVPAAAVGTRTRGPRPARKALPVPPRRLGRPAHLDPDLRGGPLPLQAQVPRTPATPRAPLRTAPAPNQGSSVPATNPWWLSTTWTTARTAKVIPPRWKNTKRNKQTKKPAGLGFLDKCRFKKKKHQPPFRSLRKP